MEQITLRIDDGLLQRIDDEADEHDVSRSEYIRNTLESREQFEKEIDELETELERARRERRQILEQREENTDLVEYVEKEKDLQERRQEWMDADLVTRAKWRLFGRD